MGIKVGIFTDPHCSLREQTVKTRRPSRSLVKIKKTMDIFCESGVEYVLCLGDIVDNCGGDEENREMLKIVMELVRSYGIPFYTLLGNHDHDNFSKEDNYAIGEIEPPPRTIRLGKTLMVFLDANYYDDGTPYYPTHSEWTNCYIPQDQLDFYAKECAVTDAEEVLVFMHQNADPDVEHRHIIHNHEQVREALASCPKLRGVYQGHYHWGHENVIDGIPYHTLPAMCELDNIPYIIIEV